MYIVKAIKALLLEAYRGLLSVIFASLVMIAAVLYVSFAAWEDLFVWDISQWEPGARAFFLWLVGITWVVDKVNRVKTVKMKASRGEPDDPDTPCDPTTQQWHPTQKELNSIARGCMDSLKTAANDPVYEEKTHEQ